ncbi:MAG: ABC transporter permease [Acidobacteriota bacterium]
MTGPARRVAAVAREDLRLTLRDRSSIFWIFIAPFIWVFFFSFAAGGSDPASTRIGLTVVQRDPSALADRFVEQLRQENFAVTVVTDPGDLPGGDDAPGRVITIPEEFSEAIAAREKVHLNLRTTRRVSHDGTLAARVALHRATIRLLAGEAFGAMPPDEDAVRVESRWGGGRRIPSGYYQTIPGNLVLFVLLSTMAYGAALLAAERRKGLLRRLACSPLTRGQIIAGKLFGRVAVAAVQVMVFVFIGLAVFRIDWGDSPLGLIVLLVPFVFASAALGLLAGALFTKPEAASGVGVLSTLVMAAMGGCMWPSEVMPDWLRSAAHVFPTAWAMDGLHQVISWHGRAGDVTGQAAVLALFALGAAAIASRRLKIAD